MYAELQVAENTVPPKTAVGGLSNKQRTLKPVVCAGDHVVCACGSIIETEEFSRCFECLRPICWLCWEKNMGGPCAACIRKSEWAKKMVARRRVHAGGRPKVMRACRECHRKFGTRELRAHEKVCPKRQSVSAKVKR
jgi:hypothetical protein